MPVARHHGCMIPIVPPLTYWMSYVTQEFVSSKTFSRSCHPKHNILAVENPAAVASGMTTHVKLHEKLQCAANTVTVHTQCAISHATSHAASHSPSPATTNMHLVSMLLLQKLLALAHLHSHLVAAGLANPHGSQISYTPPSSRTNPHPSSQARPPAA